MVKCNKCGYENNDGSRVCLNCREILENAEGPISDPMQYGNTNRDAMAEVDEQRKKGSKNGWIIGLLLAAFIIGGIVFFVNRQRPVIDEELLGSWQSSGVGYVDVWTFEKDGTFDMRRTGTGIFSDGQNILDWYYRAEDGRLITSWSKNVNEYATATYEYQLGFSENGVQCLILIRNDGGVKTTELLYRVD